VRTSALGSWRCCIITRHASATSLPSHGLITLRPGIARSEARCSTGWCVGPSSPRPIESWLNQWITGSSISAESRIAGRA
jgi:hypothetical protein